MARKRKPETQGTQPPLRDVNAAVRAKTALDLAMAGNTDWDSVATAAGYSGRGAAFKAVQRELQRTLRPVCEEYRTLEARRLDALLTVYWPKAMSGDGWSMDRVLRIMERRAALLGLDTPPPAADGQSGAQLLIVAVPQTVIDAI